MSRHTQQFKGTGAQMCQSALLGANLYDKQQPAFQKLNRIYTPEWSKEFREEIEAALALPEISVRRAIPTSKRNELKSLSADCTYQWSLLKGIIISLSSKEGSKATLAVAGSSHYKKALKNKWTETAALMRAGMAFINDKMDWLLADGTGMNPSFPAEFLAAAEAFQSAKSGFFSSKQNMSISTTAKVKALNMVYSKLTAMLANGKRIFRRNPTLRDMYAYTNLLSMVRSGKKTKSGIRFTIVSGNGAVAVAKASINILPTNASFTTGAKGTVLCHHPAGICQYLITAPGFASYTGIANITTGAAQRIRIVLQKSTGNAAVA